MPAVKFQDAAELDGVVGVFTFAVSAQAAKFHLHDRRIGGVAVAELDEVIVPAFKPPAPIGCLVAIFNALGLGGDLREESAVQIQVKDGGFGHGLLFLFSAMLFKRMIISDSLCVIFASQSSVINFLFKR